ncbi:unnamed protein product, partial [Medioppia subpectinata]
RASPDPDVRESTARQAVSQCEQIITKGCTHRTNFTDQELDRVRDWIQHKYMTEAFIKPDTTPCRRLYVRKDFKCMTEGERMAFIRAVRQVYLNGVMDRLADIHYGYWVIHKTDDFVPFHRVLQNELEKELMKVDPTVTLPYWETSVDFASPEKSLIFDYFGHAGTHNNSYCVRDGPLYGDLELNRCVRRQWHLDKYMPAWDSPEINTVLIQNARTYGMLSQSFTGYHFLVHLAFGYGSTMSVTDAPYDILFYLFHCFLTEAFAAKVQLGQPQFLAPESYNNFIKVDQMTGLVYKGRLQTDRVTYFNDVRVLDMLSIGFGNYCYVTDAIAEDVLNTIDNIKPPVPAAIQRMPRNIQRTYYPKFYSGNYSVFDYYMPDVGDCNAECRPMPLFQGYADTENGLRQMRRFYYDENINELPFYLHVCSQCEQTITHGCTHRTNFTNQELDKVRDWIQHKYMTEAFVKPDTTPCRRLYVRKDFKCMTEGERMAFIRAVRRLYLNGVMDRLADIHYGYWPAGHKTADFVPFHRQLGNELEKELMKIDPSVTLPYWGTPVDFATPHKSLIFDYFGHAGTHNNSYCVRDGPLYGFLDINRCMRRQWHLDKYMPAWEAPEIDTSLIQNADSYIILSLQLVGFHFYVHLAFGYAADMSLATAPYE